MSNPTHDLVYYAEQMNAGAVEAKAELGVTLSQEIWIGELIPWLLAAGALIVMTAVLNHLLSGDPR